MRKLRIFVVEGILAALLVGWYIWKFPETLEPVIPWILWAICAHLTWEVVLEREAVKSYICGVTRKENKNYMVWVVAFVLGGSISICYLVVARRAVAKLNELGKSHELQPVPAADMKSPKPENPQPPTKEPNSPVKPPLHSQKPTAAPATVAQKPDLSMVLVYPKSFAIIFQNDSDVVLREPKYSPAIYNLDRLDASGNPTPLPIPVFSGDWIRPRESMGPMSATGLPTVQPLLKDGDRLFGTIVVSCPDCVATKAYWVYAVQGLSGWYYKIPEGRIVTLTGLAEAAKKVRESPDTSLLELAPIEGRFPIAEITPQT